MRAGQPRNGARAELPARAKARPCCAASLECRGSPSRCETGGSQIEDRAAAPPTQAEARRTLRSPSQRCARGNYV